ncbi:histidine phosphatase superfamily [Cantharellus anzutake]|uniref:histidine phosphatase superfamily n=1 Tax=Cantharellus anzutake TaxID=1750568 RepID=UPI0019087943|nr:histidine phosphatase superfamily [Cantharellus anzutake]KAF8333104.1 histidine phosphatase superfamily [Cantharellus anzutake]
MTSTGARILGVLVLSMYGDKLGEYQNPYTYDSSGLALTPLGEVQEYQLGRYLWQTYFNDTSPSHVSEEVPLSTLLSGGGILFEADGGGDGRVIYDSATALTQGMWPPLSKSNLGNMTLANGTSVLSPLQGLQYIPIAPIDPADDVSFEGWLDCPTFWNATRSFYNSTDFKKVASDNAAFLDSLSSLVGNRTTNLTQMMGIYGFVNTEYIHNPAFHLATSSDTLTKTRQLANYYAAGVYSSSDMGSIHNIPGRALLPKILKGVNRLADLGDPLRFYSMSMSYEPFMSLFNMMGVSGTFANISGIINYAGAAAFEVRTDMYGNNPVIRFLVKNGTSDSGFTTYSLFGGTKDVSLKQFRTLLQPHSLNTLSSWCYTCDNNFSRGCEANSTIPVPPNPFANRSNNKLTAVASGLIGAGATLFVALLSVTVCMMTGFLKLGKRGKRLSAVMSAPGHHPRRGSDFKDGMDDDDVQLRKWDRMPDGQKSTV